MTQSILRIQGLCLKVANQQLFTGLEFSLPPVGITALMGPVGIGKSSLLAWLSGDFNSMLFEASWDEIEYFHAPLSNHNRPELFRQKAAKSLDETMKMVDRLLVSNPALLCIDEVTAPLAPDEAEVVLRRLSVVAQSRTVLMVSHNQSQVESYADSVLLLAGGIAQEHTPTQSFFSSPHSSVGRQFLRTGGADVVRVGTDPKQLRSDLRDVPTEMRLNLAVTGWENPIRWLVGDRFGVFRPSSGGPVSESESQMLRDQGVSMVVVVSHEEPPVSGVFEQAGLASIWHQVQASEMVSVHDSKKLCWNVQRQLDADRKIVVVTNAANHFGERTAASQLVYMGLSADKAANVAQSLVHKSEFGVQDEQLLWDLELENDLETGNTSYEVIAPDQDKRPQGNELFTGCVSSKTMQYEKMTDGPIG